jgi:hypothetical protein
LIKLLATIYKDALILCRDRAGLAVLYVMPTVLVLVVSLVQDGALRAAGEKSEGCHGKMIQPYEGHIAEKVTRPNPESQGFAYLNSAVVQKACGNPAFAMRRLAVLEINFYLTDHSTTQLFDYSTDTIRRSFIDRSKISA